MSDRSPITGLRYERISRAILDEPWAIMPSKLEAIAEFVTLKLAGGSLSEAEIQAVTALAPPTEGRREGVVAVLPVFGVLMNRLNMMSAMSGGTSTQMLSRLFARLVADPDVAAIVLDIDSPGGAVAGIPEFTALIARARAVKPVVAVADALAASAAYWVAAAAHQVVVSPSAEVGSVGAVMIHQERSRALDAEGITVTPIIAGRFKVEGNPFEPLGDEAKGALQKRVDEAYAAFTSDLARLRGVSLSDARGARFGEGRVFGAKEAVERGMADRVETLEETVLRLSTPRGRQAVFGSRAEALGLSGSAELSSEDAPQAAQINVDELAAAIAGRMKENP